MTDFKQKCLARLRFIQILIDNSCLFNIPYRASIVLYVIPVKSKKINPPTYRTCLVRIYEEIVYNKIHKFQKKILNFSVYPNARKYVSLCLYMFVYVCVCKGARVAEMFWAIMLITIKHICMCCIRK